MQKKILVFDDSQHHALRYEAEIKNFTDFEPHPYINADEFMEEVTRHGNEYTMVIMDWGEHRRKSPQMVAECIKQGLNVMIRTNADEGDWTLDAKAEISEILGHDVGSKVEFYAINDTYRDNHKFQRFIPELRSFIRRHSARVESEV